MISLIQTNSQNLQFRKLVEELDKEIEIRYVDDHEFFSQFNSIDKIKYVVLALDGNTAIGCGAIKEYSEDTLEVKRMFVREEFRGRGIAAMILGELENWTLQLGYSKCILETGEKQPEAIRLYQKCKYQAIPNYGQYIGVKASRCFEKHLMK